VLNGVSMEREGDFMHRPFNLCVFAASKDRWDIVQLALSNGCSCSQEVQLELLGRQAAVHLAR